MKTNSKSILLGFEIGTGNPVEIPLAHTVVTGRTQESGKTTTLAALISRSNRQALSFITKRSEKAFPSGTVIPPYFHEHCDWRFVESILEAQMREKMKYQRQWIVKVTEGARSLADVHRNIQRRMAKVGPDSYAGGMYLLLSEYFKLLMPELNRIQLVSRPLRLSSGLNVMDLRDYADMQPLAIASSIEAAYHLDDVTVCLPEAWEFIPEERNTPVKMAATAFIKKAAGSGNYLWIDSQDLASVDKGILKQVGVWILGVQGEINEVKHTLAQVALPQKQKPKPEEIQQLGLGQFYVCYGTVTKKVYVQPLWMDEGRAVRIAKGESWKSFGDGVAFIDKPEDTNVDYKQAYEDLKERFDALERQVRESGLIPVLIDYTAGRDGEVPAVIKGEPHLLRTSQSITSQRLEDASSLDDAKVPVIELNVDKPEIEVTVRRFTIKMGEDSVVGQLAYLISEGFFDKAQSVKGMYDEFRDRGWMAQLGRPTPLGGHLQRLIELGFLRRVGDQTYQIRDGGVKVRVKEVEVEA